MTASDAAKPTKEQVYRQHVLMLSTLANCPVCGSEAEDFIESSMGFTERVFDCRLTLVAHINAGIIRGTEACTAQSHLVAAWLNDLGLARAK